MTFLSRLAAESQLFMQGFQRSNAHLWLTWNETRAWGYPTQEEKKKKNSLLTCLSKERGWVVYLSCSLKYNTLMQHSRQCISLPVQKVWPEEVKFSHKNLSSVMQSADTTKMHISIFWNVSSENVCVLQRFPTSVHSMCWFSLAEMLAEGFGSRLKGTSVFLLSILPAKHLSLTRNSAAALFGT